ncbi:MAG: 30S ribosomal protein S24e [Sulfolobus sp.]
MSQQLKVKVSDKVEGVIEREVVNNVLKRREVYVKLYHIGVGTPSRKEVIKALASLYNTGEDLIVIKKTSTIYGAGISYVRANIYENKEILQKIEPQYLIGRDTGQKVKKGGKGGQKQG